MADTMEERARAWLIREGFDLSTPGDMDTRDVVASMAAFARAEVERFRERAADCCDQDGDTYDETAHKIERRIRALPIDPEDD